MRRAATAVIFGLLLLVVAPPANAQEGDEPGGRDPAFEQEIYDRLAAIDPDAVPLFQQATEAMDSGNLAAAQAGYQQVLALAPDFPDALRRLSYVESALGNVDAGVEYARAALAVEDSPLNQSALASALISTDNPSNDEEALELARAAASADPDDAYFAYTLAWAGLLNGDTAAVRQGTNTLLRVTPDDWVGHFFAGVLAADNQMWIDAEREIRRAEELGAPAELVDWALDEGGIASGAFQMRLLEGGIIAVGAWLSGLFLLFVCGSVLSQATLRAIKRTQPGDEFHIGPAERFIRWVYRAVIGLSSLYFYISMPVLILIVVAATGGIFYMFMAMGRIPVRLAAALVLFAIYTLFAILRSVFTRVKLTEPGKPLSREDAPRLWALLEEVAERIGTRPVDAIYLTPLPGIGVTERGPLPAILGDRAERALILGLGSLPGMTQSHFKAVIAHEYGHFTGRDAAGGKLAFQIRASMQRMAQTLIAGRQARWYNPAWLFLYGFNRIYLRITLGASRLQEVLADRFAALTYGADTFIQALTHVVRQDFTFKAQAGREIQMALERQKPPDNLYVLSSARCP
jgi:Zn-dependent protease with chaperone function